MKSNTSKTQKLSKNMTLYNLKYYLVFVKNLDVNCIVVL